MFKEKYNPKNIYSDDKQKKISDDIAEDIEKAALNDSEEYMNSLIEACSPLVFDEKDNNGRLTKYEKEDIEKSRELLDEIVFELLQHHLSHPAPVNLEQDILMARNMIAKRMSQVLEKSRDQGEEILAAKILGKCALPDAAPALLLALKKKIPIYKDDLSQAVEEALINTSRNDPNVYSELKLIFENEKNKKQTKSARSKALGIMVKIAANDEKKAIIAKAMADQDENVIAAAIENLPPEMIDEEMADKLIDHLRHGKNIVKYQAAIKLSEIKNKKIIQPMGEALVKGEVPVYIALGAFKNNFDQSIFDYLAAMLKSGGFNYNEKREAVILLRSLNNESVAGLLIDFIDQPEDGEIQADDWDKSRCLNEAYSAIGSIKKETEGPRAGQFLYEKLMKKENIGNVDADVLIQAILKNEPALPDSQLVKIIEKFGNYSSSNRFINGMVVKINDFESLYALLDKMSDNFTRKAIAERILENYSHPEAEKIILNDLAKYFSEEDALLFDNSSIDMLVNYSSPALVVFFKDLLKKEAESDNFNFTSIKQAADYLNRHQQDDLISFLADININGSSKYLNNINTNIADIITPQTLADNLPGMDKEKQEGIISVLSSFSSSRYRSNLSLNDKTDKVVKGLASGQAEKTSVKINALNVLAQIETVENADFLIGQLEKNIKDTQIKESIAKALQIRLNRRDKGMTAEWFLEKSYRRKIFYDLSTRRIYEIFKLAEADKIYSLLEKNPQFISLSKDAATAGFLFSELAKNSNDREMQDIIARILSDNSLEEIASPEWFLENECRKNIFCNPVLIDLYKKYGNKTADNLNFLLSGNPNHASFFLNDSILGNQHKNMINSLAVYARSNDSKALEKKIVAVRDAWTNNNLPSAWKSAFFAGIFLEMPDYLPKYGEDINNEASDWKKFCRRDAEEKKLIVQADSFDNEIRSGSANMKNFLEAVRDGEREISPEIYQTILGLFSQVNIYQNYSEKNHISPEKLEIKKLAESLLAIMEERRELSDEANRRLYDDCLKEFSWEKIMPKETLLHGKGGNEMASVLDNGFRCGEMLGKIDPRQAEGDVTNFDFDTSVVLSAHPDEKDLAGSIASEYGQVIYAFRPRPDSFREKREIMNTEWPSWANDPRFRGVRTALPSDECSGIIIEPEINQDILKKYFSDIAEGGRFIPLFNSRGGLIKEWSPDKFDELRPFFYDLRMKGYERTQANMIYDFYRKMQDSPESGLKRAVMDIVSTCARIKPGGRKEREALLFDSLAYIKNHQEDLALLPAVLNYQSQPMTMPVMRNLLKAGREHARLIKKNKSEAFEDIFRDKSIKNVNRFAIQTDFLNKQGINTGRFAALKEQITRQENIDNDLLAEFYGLIMDKLAENFYEKAGPYRDRVVFIGTGSIGRGDAAIGSDIDYAIYIDDEGANDDEREDIRRKIEQAGLEISALIEKELDTVADAGKEKKDRTPLLFFTQVRDMEIDLSKKNSRDPASRQSVEPTTVVDAKPFGNEAVAMKIKKAFYANEQVRQNFSEYMFNDLYAKSEKDDILGYKHKWDMMVENIISGQGIANVKFELQRPIQFKIQYLTALAIEKGQIDLSAGDIMKAHNFREKIAMLKNSGVFSDLEADNCFELYDYAQDMRIRSEIQGRKGYDVKDFDFKNFTRLIYLVRYFDEHIIGKGIL